MGVIQLNCEFIEIDGIKSCKNCGFTLKKEYLKPVHRKCDLSTKLEYPSILEMGSNFVKSTIDFVKDGGKTVDEEEQTRRTSICTGNAEYGIPACPAYDKSQNRCTECGCFLNWATAINSKHCPLNKW